MGSTDSRETQSDCEHRILRNEGLDWLRGRAIMLVVLLHCAVPYLLTPMPGLAWPTHDLQPSRSVDMLFWWIESFIMPLFFLMSGYFAAISLERHSVAGLMRQRWNRLGKPLLWGMLCILPFELYVWMTGWLIDGRIPLRKMRSLKLPDDLQQDLWGLGHLWYLQYLLILCGGLALWHWSREQRVQRDMLAVPQRGTPPTSWIRLALIASTGCSVLVFAQPRIVCGFQHGFLPFPLKLIHSAWFFGLGVYLHRRGLPSRASRCLQLGIPLAGITVFLLAWPQIHEWNKGEQTLEARLTLGPLMGFAAGLGAVGWFQLALGRRAAVRPLDTWLAKASFTIYLVHHPLAGLTHVSLMNQPWTGSVKFIVTSIVVTGISTGLYLVIWRHHSHRRIMCETFQDSSSEEFDRSRTGSRLQDRAA